MNRVTKMPPQLCGGTSVANTPRMPSSTCQTLAKPWIVCGRPHRLRNPVAPVERRRCRGHLRHLRPVDADVLQPTAISSDWAGRIGPVHGTEKELAQLGAA